MTSKLSFAIYHAEAIAAYQQLDCAFTAANNIYEIRKYIATHKPTPSAEMLLGGTLNIRQIVASSEGIISTIIEKIKSFFKAIGRFFVRIWHAITGRSDKDLKKVTEALAREQQTTVSILQQLNDATRNNTDLLDKNKDLLNKLDAATHELERAKHIAIQTGINAKEDARKQTEAIIDRLKYIVSKYTPTVSLPDGCIIPNDAEYRAFISCTPSLSEYGFNNWLDKIWMFVDYKGLEAPSNQTPEKLQQLTDEINVVDDALTKLIESASQRGAADGYEEIDCRKLMSSQYAYDMKRAVDGICDDLNGSHKIEKGLTEFLQQANNGTDEVAQKAVAAARKLMSTISKYGKLARGYASICINANDTYNYWERTNRYLKELIDKLRNGTVMSGER